MLLHEMLPVSVYAPYAPYVRHVAGLWQDCGSTSMAMATFCLCLWGGRRDVSWHGLGLCFPAADMPSCYSHR